MVNCPGKSTRAQFLWASHTTSQVSEIANQESDNITAIITSITDTHTHSAVDNKVLRCSYKDLPPRTRNTIGWLKIDQLYNL